MCKSWVVSLQCMCVWFIWVAAHAQRRCCCFMYMSKDYVMSLQCMWLQCMYIDLIKRKIDRFTASCRCVDVQKLNRVFAVYVCMSYMSSTCEYRAVTALCVIALRVNRSENRNRSIYCVAQMYMCAKAESCLRNDCVNVVY